jgi:putative NIF3 family GTP cyclohydrolase 1 type 2
MVSLDEVVAYLDAELKTAAISDYPGAMNGLQLTNVGKIGRIVAAVDASLPVVQAAAEGGPGLLIVHHGMFWQGAQPVTGAFYRKLKLAMDAGLAS